MQNALSIANEEEPMAEEAREGARDSALFAALVERQSHLVYRIALAVVRNPCDAEDVAQETFLQLYRGSRSKMSRDTWRGLPGGWPSGGMALASGSVSRSFRRKLSRSMPAPRRRPWMRNFKPGSMP